MTLDRKIELLLLHSLLDKVNKENNIDMKKIGVRYTNLMNEFLREYHISKDYE